MAMHIKAARVNAGLTQNEVIDRLNALGFSTAKSTLVSWEQEKTFPQVPQFNALCKIYGCTMNDIFVPETLT